MFFTILNCPRSVSVSSGAAPDLEDLVIQLKILKNKKRGKKNIDGSSACSLLPSCLVVTRYRTMFLKRFPQGLVF